MNILRRQIGAVGIVILASSAGVAAQTNTFPLTGNAGIGTTSPASSLEVGTGWVTVDSTGSNYNEGLRLNAAPNGFATISLGGASGSTSGVVPWSIHSEGGGTNFFDIRNNGITRFVLLPSGFVGVGTMTPTNLFQVGSGGTSGKSIIYSQDANHGQLQIGNPASNAEASINFESGITAFGDNPTSQNGITNLWGLGAGVWGIGGSKFALGNDGYGGAMFTAQSNGNIGIGTTSPAAKLEIDGNLKLTSGSGASMTFADGTVQSTAYTGVTCGGDYAESVDVTGDRHHYEPGDVLVIDPKVPGKFLKSAEPYSTSVTGIYSTKPGTIGRRQTGPKNPDEVPMAMIGIVPTKVNAENGPIHPGDLLVTSSTMGYAMRGTDRSRMLGAVIGKALGNLDAGKGVVEVVVTLQ